MLKKVVFRIRKQYFDQIVKGTKKVEYRKFSKSWQKKLENAKVAVFICGKKVHRRIVERVEHIQTPLNFSAQGKKDVPTASCFAVYLGEEIG